MMSDAVSWTATAGTAPSFFSFSVLVELLVTASLTESDELPGSPSTITASGAKGFCAIRSCSEAGIFGAALAGPAASSASAATEMMRREPSRIETPSVVRRKWAGRMTNHDHLRGAYGFSRSPVRGSSVEIPRLRKPSRIG